jgi:membrane protein
VAAISFEIMKRGFGLYIQLFPTYALIYGAFATVPIFLLWIYLSWLIVLFGAVVVAVLPRWRMGVADQEDEPGARFYTALKLIEELYRSQDGAHAPGTAQLAAASAASEDEIERLLERMEAEHWVRRVEPSGWVLGRDLESLRVADLYRSFVLRARPSEPRSRMEKEVAALLGTEDERLNVSVGSLLERSPADDAGEDSREPPAAAERESRQMKS